MAIWSWARHAIFVTKLHKSCAKSPRIEIWPIIFISTYFWVYFINRFPFRLFLKIIKSSLMPLTIEKICKTAIIIIFKGIMRVLARNQWKLRVKSRYQNFVILFGACKILSSFAMTSTTFFRDYIWWSTRKHLHCIAADWRKIWKWSWMYGIDLSFFGREGRKNPWIMVGIGGRGHF